MKHSFFLIFATEVLSQNMLWKFEKWIYHPKILSPDFRVFTMRPITISSNILHKFWRILISTTAVHLLGSVVMLEIRFSSQSQSKKGLKTPKTEFFLHIFI